MDEHAVLEHEVGDRGGGHPDRLTTTPATRRVIAAGAMLDSAAAAWFIAPGIETERPRSRSRSAAATTWSADCYAISGTPVGPSPARSWNSVWVYPGHTSITCTPVPRASSCTAWVKLCTNALVAP